MVQIRKTGQKKAVDILCQQCKKILVIRADLPTYFYKKIPRFSGGLSVTLKNKSTFLP
jgi:phage FluMu protein Com